MNRKQLAGLFICMLVPWTLGNGLLPLLPVYAAQLGASSAISGYYLSFAYLSLAVGTFAAGWLSDRLQQRKKLLIICGFISFPIIWMMGAATDVLELTILTSLVWFLGGINITLLNILAGLFADKTQRGRTFGILALSSGLGALIGGLSTGPIADRWGFAGLFAVMAILSLVLPIQAFFLEDKRLSTAKTTSQGETVPASRMDLFFYFFMLASISAGIAIFAGRLGTTLAMKELQLNSAAISSTGAVGGLITMPLSLYLGILSDRVGRKNLLVLCYICGALGVGMMIVSAELWHFWIAASLISVMAYVSPGVGSALVTDLVSPDKLGRGMSFFNATTWIGGILGFAASGLAFEILGLNTSFWIITLLPAVAILLLSRVKENKGS